MTLDRLVQDYVQVRYLPAARGVDTLVQARALLQETTTHVGRVARRYPDPWFVGGRATPEAVLDLADRVYFRCDRVAMRPAPFLGRDPFEAYASDRLTHGQIATLTFYRRRSITRSVMRTDYEHNLARDPIARWEAELYRMAGQGLRAVAQPSPRTAGPPIWRLAEPGRPRLQVPPSDLGWHLRQEADHSPPALAAAALRRCGSLTQAQLAGALADVYPAPPWTGGPSAAVGWEGDEVPEPVLVTGEPAMETRLAVRAEVWRAWQRLLPEERQVLAAVAEGATYEEIAGADGSERLRKRLAAINAVLVAHLRGALPPGRPTLGPQELAELIYEVVQLIAPGQQDAEEDP